MSTKQIEWRVNARTHRKFWEMVRALGGLQPDSEEAEVLREDIKCLPGFPKERLVGREAPVVNVVLTQAGDKL